MKEKINKCLEILKNIRDEKMALVGKNGKWELEEENTNMKFGLKTPDEIEELIDYLIENEEIVYIFSYNYKK